MSSQNQPDYRALYEAASLELENLKRQIEHQEMKSKLLAKLIDQQITQVSEFEYKAELLKSGALDMKKLGINF